MRSFSFARKDLHPFDITEGQRLPSMAAEVRHRRTRHASGPWSSLGKPTRARMTTIETRRRRVDSQAAMARTTGARMTTIETRRRLRTDVAAFGHGRELGPLGKARTPLQQKRQSIQTFSRDLCSTDTWARSPCHPQEVHQSSAPIVLPTDIWARSLLSYPRCSVSTVGLSALSRNTAGIPRREPAPRNTIRSTR